MKLNDDEYRKETVPDSNGFGKPKIGVWFDVMDIPEVNEPEVSNFQAQLYLSLLLSLLEYFRCIFL